MVCQSALRFDRDLDIEAVNASMAVERYLDTKGLSGVQHNARVLTQVPALREIVEFLAFDEAPKLAVANEHTTSALLGPVLEKGSLWIVYAPELSSERIKGLLDSTELVVGNNHWPSPWDRHVETDFGVPETMFAVLGPVPLPAPVIVLAYFGRTHCGVRAIGLDEMTWTDYQVNRSVSGRNYRPLQTCTHVELEASVPSENDRRAPNALVDGAKMLIPFWQRDANDPVS